MIVDASLTRGFARFTSGHTRDRGDRENREVLWCGVVIFNDRLGSALTSACLEVGTVGKADEDLGAGCGL
jgi:hypothetical protein